MVNYPTEIEPSVSANINSYDVITASSGSCVLKEHPTISDEQITPAENEDALVQSTYNMENCNDVVVGPVTHFHCPVTIIQRSDKSETSLSALDKKSSSPNGGSESELKLLERLKPRKKLIYTAAALTLLVLLTLIVISVLFAQRPTTDSIVDDYGNDDTDDDIFKTRIIPRLVWGARPPLSIRKLETPVEYIIVAHTAGANCDSVTTCSPILQTLQSIAISTESPDIGYNFLVDSVGHIYIGRGWDAINYLQNHCIAVAFLGNFYYDKFTEQMQKALKDLIGLGVKKEKITSNYTILSHSQTFATLSPGDNIRNVIKTWPHYYPKDYINLPD